MLCKVNNSFLHNTRAPSVIFQQKRRPLFYWCAYGKYVFLIVKCILDFDFLWVNVEIRTLCSVLWIICFREKRISILSFTFSPPRRIIFRDQLNFPTKLTRAFYFPCPRFQVLPEVVRIYRCKWVNLGVQPFACLPYLIVMVWVPKSWVNNSVFFQALWRNRF